jgi:hypothetical protein
MKTYLKAALMSVMLASFTSCGTIAIQSLETEYGTLSTNVDGSQSFTTKPSKEAPVVVGTVVTDKGTVTVNPDGSYTFKSKPAVVEIAPKAEVIADK